MSTEKRSPLAEEMRKALDAFRAQNISATDVVSDEEVLATLATDKTITPETIKEWRNRRKITKENEPGSKNK